MNQTVGIVGVGIMGTAMARNLRETGFTVVGYDPVPAASARLNSLGGQALASPRAVAEAAPITIMSLPKAEALTEVIGGADGVANATGTGQIVIECSTLPLDIKQAAFDVMQKSGKVLLDCPISGTGAQAVAKDLVILGSGDKAAFERCAPVFAGMSRVQHYLGPFGRGSIMKYIANHLVTIHNVAAAEAMVLGIKAGIDPAIVYDTLADSAGTSRMFQMRGPLMRDERYDEPTATIRMQLKDIAIIDAFAAGLDCALPVYAAASQVYHAGSALGRREQDTAAVCAVLETMHGIDRKTLKPQSRRRFLSSLSLSIFERYGMADLTIMVAPNGARKGHAEHHNLPLTAEAIAADALACKTAGAQAVHMHVRDADGRHTLDASRYLAATEAVRRLVGPEFVIQITTEAVGMFRPDEQIAVVRAVRPEAVSIATKELIPDASAEAAAADLYRWAHEQKIAVQHIVYAANEFDHLLDLMKRGIIPGRRHSVIFPLGRYAVAQESDPAELAPFVAKVRDNGGTERFDWWVCAFGASETASLVAAAAMGGHCRIGFENSFMNADGSRADSNAERVQDLQAALCGIHRPRSSRAQILRALGRPDQATARSLKARFASEIRNFAGRIGALHALCGALRRAVLAIPATLRYLSGDKIKSINQFTGEQA